MSLTLDQLTTQLTALEAQLQAELSNLEVAQFSTSSSSQKATLENQYFGKDGQFTQLASVIRDFSPAEKKVAGPLINQTKVQLQKLIAQAFTQAHQTRTNSNAHIDLTQPATQKPRGHLHPVTHAIEEITRIFNQIGFIRVRHPEVDLDYYAFEALNMPPTHPARDEWETFFVHNPATPDKKNLVMTPHTSNGQPREIKRLNSQPPIRMINIGRCYRRQQDATHTEMFHQFEGLVVDENINIGHLKGVLDYFAQEFYGTGTKSRIRPFHFQFTEPSFEIDFSCHICGGTGQIIDPQTGQNIKCRFCKSGWHEVGGAGMVHPHVLTAGGIDPDKYTGFAFGWGIERTYTLQPHLNIDDIRLFYSGNLKFLQQF